jgi:uncharacterized protein (DUF1330 family)
MTAYVVAHLTAIKDADTFARYREAVAPALARAGGRYVVRGGDPHMLDGEKFGRVIVIEFPSMEAARGFFEGPEYAPLRKLRLSAADGSIAIFPGYETAPAG